MLRYFVCEAALAWGGERRDHALVEMGQRRDGGGWLGDGEERWEAAQRCCGGLQHRTMVERATIDSPSLVSLPLTFTPSPPQTSLPAKKLTTPPPASPPSSSTVSTTKARRSRSRARSSVPLSRLPSTMSSLRGWAGPSLDRRREARRDRLVRRRSVRMLG